MTRTLIGNANNLDLKRLLRRQMTRAENSLWLRLRAKQFYGLKFRRQHGIGPYIVDFYCPEKAIIIEVDGDVHADEIHIIKDQKREKDLKSLGLSVIRYNNDDVINNFEGVLEDLKNRLLLFSTSP